MADSASGVSVAEASADGCGSGSGKVGSDSGVYVSGVGGCADDEGSGVEWANAVVESGESAGISDASVGIAEDSGYECLPLQVTYRFSQPRGERRRGELGSGK